LDPNGAEEEPKGISRDSAASIAKDFLICVDMCNRKSKTVGIAGSFTPGN
jgi:hypothetical protein